VSERSERALKEDEKCYEPLYTNFIHSIALVLLTRLPPAPLKCTFASLGADVEENDKIESALARFFSPEIVDIVCEKCTTGKTATQTAQFTKLPGALILHMKRFVVYEKPDKSFSLRKNAAPVEFGETINLEKFCEDDFEYPAMPRALQFDKSSSTEKKLEGNGKGSNNNNNNTNANFSMKSVVHHIGSNAFSGHYVTDVKKHNSWTRFNDSVAKESSQAEVFGTGENRKTAYMCVYAYNGSVAKV
tara:strand:- start:125 stop:862 length:738 start_codon:yes stop_codon:yes gene_type:complete